MNVQLIELYFRDESQINDTWINLKKISSGVFPFDNSKHKNGKEWDI